MKFWQSLAFVELDQMTELARFCEDLGFYGVSYGEHLLTTQQQTDHYRYQEDGNILWNPDTHWPDPWVMTAHLAAVTTTLNFLSTVYVLPLHDPFSAAKAISTATILSADRVVLGVGVGWQKAEFDIVGQNFHNRGKRTDEALLIVRNLMRGDMIEHHGEHYDFPALQMSPGTARPVPIMVGGYAPAALRRAAQFDGWMATAHEEAELYPLVEKALAARAQAGGTLANYDIWSGVINPRDGCHERLAEAGVTMTNGANFFAADGRTILATVDQKKKRIEDFAKRFITR